MRNIDKYKADLDDLVSQGKKIELWITLSEKKNRGALNAEHKILLDELGPVFSEEYQNWFTESCAVIKQLIPDRLNEFVYLYQSDSKRKEINYSNYSIQDWLNGVISGRNGKGEKIFNDFAIASMRFMTQLKILQSVAKRFESTLFDIKQIVQADIFDSELEAARELLKHKFIRGAGAISGVVLEKHLAQVCTNHNVKLTKKHPTISDFNDLLKASSVIDLVQWRQIQRLGDIRNLCDHNKDREPTIDECDELISGVDKLTKTLF